MSLDEARKKKAAKCAALVVAGVIVQTAIILLFVFLVLRVHRVRVRVGSVQVDNLSVNYSSTNPSFTMSLDMQLNVKNPNFGHYKFERSELTVSYRGHRVGVAVIEKAAAGAFSTKHINVAVAMNSTAVSSSGRNSKMMMRKDIFAGVLTLNSQAALTGKVHLFEIFKTRKSTGMNCSMEVNIKSKAIQNLECHRI